MKRSKLVGLVFLLLNMFAVAQHNLIDSLMLRKGDSLIIDVFKVTEINNQAEKIAFKVKSDTTTQAYFYSLHIKEYWFEKIKDGKKSEVKAFLKKYKLKLNRHYKQNQTPEDAYQDLPTGLSKVLFAEFEVDSTRQCSKKAIDSVNDLIIKLEKKTYSITSIAGTYTYFDFTLTRNGVRAINNYGIKGLTHLNDEFILQ